MALTLAGSKSTIIAVVRSTSTTWGSYGSVLENRSGGRLGNIFESGATNFHFNPYPTSVRKNGIVAVGGGIRVLANRLGVGPTSLRDLGNDGPALTIDSTDGEVRGNLVGFNVSGITAAVILAASRAIGETMIVTMAAGLQARMTFNPLDTVTTVTVQIVTLLTGDQEFDSPKTLAAFALGFVLFIVTLLLNIVALRVVKKYREAYE